MDDEAVFVEKRARKNFEPGELIRPLENCEYVSAWAGLKYNNNFNTVQLLWLTSDHPIDPVKVKEAIVLMAKNISVLQLCIIKRRGKLWFKRMASFVVDFKVTDDHFLSLYDYLIETPYDYKNGPLWRVRFIQSSKDPNSNRYKSVIGYGVQHCITDGPTIMTLLRQTTHILNALIKGKEPVLVPSGMCPVLKMPFKKWPSLFYMTKITWQDFQETCLNNFTHQTTFNGLLPRPIVKRPETKIFFDDLTQDETASILAKCKSAGVTVHSFVSACCNFALMRLAQRRSKVDIGSRVIKVAHSVDGRRYFQANDKSSSGCHLIIQPLRTKNSLKDEFWPAVKELHKDFKNRVNIEEEPMKLIPFGEVLLLSFGVNSFLHSRSFAHRTHFHLCTTNMGNLKTHLPDPKPGDPVEISYILRSFKYDLGHFPFTVTFHTLRGRLLLSMDCYTGKLPEDLGKEYFEILISYIKQIAATGNVVL